METQAEHFLKVLHAGTVATNVYLRRIHNFALDMNWLPWPVLPKKRWPKVRFKEKRGITREEHEAIIAREFNAERKAFYQLCWHLGGSQTDVARLQADDIDWEHSVIGFSRKKTKTIALVRFGNEVEALLRVLPTSGPLFPHLRDMHAKHRAKLFKLSCKRASVCGVTLHMSGMILPISLIRGA